MLEPKIIYEDENILALNKPRALLTHGNEHSREPTLVDWLVKNYPAVKNVGDPNRPGLVHRLDKEASGVLLAAKNQAAYQFLKKQFQERRVLKTYRLIVHGEVKAPTGVIDLPIGRSRRDPRRRRAGRGASGKLRPAQTAYRVLKRFPHFTYLEASPLTGRTHQLRVHFKALGHPVAGDPLYGPKNSPVKQLALHALSLEFDLPGGGRIKLTADPPPDFRATLASLRQL